MPKKEPFKFDLVSDLHVDRWDEEIDWESVRNHDVVIVAGDVADSVELTRAELERLSKAYKTVLYIDGNHEFCEDIYGGTGDGSDFDDRLRLAIADLPNVHFLKDSVFVFEGLAIIGRNGHWDYKALLGFTEEEAVNAVADKLALPKGAEEIFKRFAKQDADDLKQLVRELNDDPAIHSILVVTHTVPCRELFPKNMPDMPAFFSNLGSSEMAAVVDEDKNGKIKMWVFGHWHGKREEHVDGIHYVAHPRGTFRKGKPAYTPRSLEVHPPGAEPPAPAPDNSLPAPKPKAPPPAP